jgi:RND family efflux transporter MFP subunit
MVTSNKTKTLLHLLLMILALVVLLNITVRLWEDLKLSKNTDNLKVLRVNTTTAAKGPKYDGIMLPGTLLAWHDSAIFSRTDGYVKQWYVDIGSVVKKNDLLALIETPEVDAQLRQAEAQLKQAESDNALAQVTAERFRILVAKGAVSRQDADTAISAACTAADAVKAAIANRDRLTKLSGFEQLRAPYDGIITQRTTDIGNLINAGSSTTARPIFRIVQANLLRLYVKVPQSYSSRITPNLVVKLNFNQFPGVTYTSKLIRTAKAIDPLTRTILTEFEIVNTDYRLLAGAYTQVYMQIPTSTNILRLPVNTLLFRADGLSVATVNNKNQIFLKPVKLGRDFGNDVEIVSGVLPNDRIIVNPPDGAYNGQSVKIEKAKNMSKNN